MATEFIEIADARQSAESNVHLPHLSYTVAFDQPGSGGQRQVAKMLAASMARTFFSGDFVIFRNSPQPLFLVQREGIKEVFVETPAFDDPTATPRENAQALADYAMAWKARARAFIDPRRYDSVMFLDADCLALRNLDHLVERADEWDILFQREKGRGIQQDVYKGFITDEEVADLSVDGINSGSFAVKAEHYHAVMEEWERVMGAVPTQRTRFVEQSAWNRVVLDAASNGWKAKPFEAHEIQFPLHLDKDWKKYKDAAVLHCMGGDTLEKIEFMFGMYMQKFFHDPAGTMVGLLDM